MLEKLLRVLALGGAVSYGDLACTLDIDRMLVQQMVEHLARLGYLSSAAGSCGEECGACVLGDQCSSGGPDHTWTLTEKGSRAAREAR